MLLFSGLTVFAVHAPAYAQSYSAVGLAAPQLIPFTGSDAFLPLTLGGVALVAVGAGIVVVTRKRKRAEVTPTSLA